MNTLFAGFGLLIMLVLVIYMLSLVTRLVKAVEKIARRFDR
jgi:hypothetical protein